MSDAESRSPGRSFRDRTAFCSIRGTMTKACDISELLVPKLSSNSDEASKIMSEMGDATGTGIVTAETCTKLDARQVRAKKL
jgi:hypothetical protein